MFSKSTKPKVHFHSVATYRGGTLDNHEGIACRIIVSDEGIRISKGLNGGDTIPWSEIDDVAAEGSEATKSRLTLTRVATIGIFALGAKKRSDDSKTYVTVTGPNLVAVLEIEGKPAIISAKLSAAKIKAQAHAPAAA